MDRNASSKRQKHLQKKKKLISDFFNFIGTSVVLLFINYMTGNGYWWAMWPVGFYGLSILLSLINFIKEEITLDMGEETYQEVEEDKIKEQSLDPYQKKQESPYYQDALELENIPRRKEKDIIVQKKWDDRDMV